MNAFAKLVNALSAPLALINGLGGIIAGVWLAVLGEWGSIGYGIVVLITGGFALGVAMMPGLFFAAPAAASYEKGNKVAFYFFSFLNTLYTVLVLSIWCIMFLYFFVKRANNDSVIPLLLWSYGVATGPIAWLALKDLESGNEYAMIATFFAQMAYFVVILAVLFIRVSLIDILVLFGVIMFIGFLVIFRIAFEAEKALSE